MIVCEGGSDRQAAPAVARINSMLVQVDHDRGLTSDGVRAKQRCISVVLVEPLSPLSPVCAWEPEQQVLTLVLSEEIHSHWNSVPAAAYARRKRKVP